MSNATLSRVDTVKAICLPTGDAGDMILDNRNAVVTGWGNTEKGICIDRNRTAILLVFYFFLFLFFLFSCLFLLFSSRFFLYSVSFFFFILFFFIFFSLFCYFFLLLFPFLFFFLLLENQMSPSSKFSLLVKQIVWELHEWNKFQNLPCN